MKQFYSFENEQGDFTIAYGESPDDTESQVVCAVDDWSKETVAAMNTIISNVTSEAIKDRDAWQSEYRAARAEVERLKLERDTQARKERDFNTTVENQKKIMLEMGTRFRSKLMSVYYLLGAIKKMGTHHEKAVAVSFLMQTVDDLVKDGDHLSWDQDLFNLPF